MVLPVKVFEIRGLEGDIEARLKDYRESESNDEEDIELLTLILDIESSDGIIKGIISKDFLRQRAYHRKVETIPTTEEAPFWIAPYNQGYYLIVMAPSVARGVKKFLSNHVAVKLGEVLNADVRESRIESETLQKLHESNPNATNLIWFDNVDIPGVDKLCLSGQGLANTGLYKDYLDHGLIWYVVFTSQNSGYTVGITRNTVITNFSKSTEEEYIQFVRDEILKLIE